MQRMLLILTSMLALSGLQCTSGEYGEVVECTDADCGTEHSGVTGTFLIERDLPEFIGSTVTLCWSTDCVVTTIVADASGDEGHGGSPGASCDVLKAAPGQTRLNVEFRTDEQEDVFSIRITGAETPDVALFEYEAAPSYDTPTYPYGEECGPQCWKGHLPQPPSN